MHYLLRLEELKQLLKKHFQSYLSCAKDKTLFSPEKDFAELKDQIEAWGKSSGELGSDLEISCRTIFQEYLHFFTASDVIEDSNAIHFVKFMLDFAFLYPNISNAFGKIPFLLMEDLLECQTIHSSKQIWTIIESLVEKITNPTLFSKGKFVVLKTCNALLKKLSKSYDTEFCGRILMFLAAVYPISERSALNISGKINVANVTYYEDKEKFEKNIREANNQEAHQQSLTLEEDTSSAMKVVGEDGEELELSNIPFVITYDLYESFWKLQSYFASELKTFDTTWNEFMDNARKVFRTLSHSYQSSQKNHSAESNQSLKLTQNPENLSEEDQEDSSGSKYLTSSQLFALQLKDPLLRKQIAVQFLFFIHYLKVKTLPAVDTIAQKIKYEKDLKELHDQAKALIETAKGSAGNPQDFLEMIQRIFLREEHWIKWKTQGCQAFERTAVSVQSVKIEEKEEVGGEGAHKRKVDEMEQQSSLESSTTTLQPPLKKESIYTSSLQDMESKRRSYLFDTSQDNITEIVKNLSAGCPEFETQIEMYLEADNPDAGIEEEYHPKHDHLYCWRTRRLFAEKHLSYFKYMQDGNLGKGLRKLKNLPEPEPSVIISEEKAEPVNNEDKVEEEEREGSNEEKPSGNDNDEGSLVITVDEEGEMEKSESMNEEKEESERDENTPAPTASSTTPTNAKLAAVTEPEDGEEIEEPTEATTMEV